MKVQVGVKENTERVQDRGRYGAGSLVCNTCTNTHRRYATFMHIGLEQAKAHIKTSNSLSLCPVFSWLVRHKDMCTSGEDVSNRMDRDVWMEFWCGW